MSILLLALVVLGGSAYVLYMLMGYFSVSSAHSLHMEELKAGTARRSKRLTDYEERVAFHQEELPRLRQHVDQLDRWVLLLREQKATLESKQTESLDTGRQNRKEAILERFIKARHRKGL